MLTTFSLGHRWVKLPLRLLCLPPLPRLQADHPIFSIRWDSASHAGIKASGNPNSAAREASGGRTAPSPAPSLGSSPLGKDRLGWVIKPRWVSGPVAPRPPTAFHLLGSYSGSSAVPPAKPPLFSILASVYLFEPSALAPGTSSRPATIPCVRAAPRAHGAPSPAGPGARVREREALWPPSQATAPLHAASGLPRSLEGAPPKPRDWGWSGARGGASPKPVLPARAERGGGGGGGGGRGSRNTNPARFFFFLLHLI